MEKEGSPPHQIEQPHQTPGEDQSRSIGIPRGGNSDAPGFVPTRDESTIINSGTPDFEAALEPGVEEAIRTVSDGDPEEERRLRAECLRNPTLRAFFRNPEGNTLTYTGPEFSILADVEPKNKE